MLMLLSLRWRHNAWISCLACGAGGISVCNSSNLTRQPSFPGIVVHILLSFHDFDPPVSVLKSTSKHIYGYPVPCPGSFLSSSVARQEKFIGFLSSIADEPKAHIELRRSEDAALLHFVQLSSCIPGPPKLPENFDALSQPEREFSSSRETVLNSVSRGWLPPRSSSNRLWRCRSRLQKRRKAAWG
jgi:hypothetical protein